MGNGQELVLPDLSPADAATFSCNVTVSSAIPVLLIKQIVNQSIFDLVTKSKTIVLCLMVYVLSYHNMYIPQFRPQQFNSHLVIEMCIIQEKASMQHVTVMLTV